MDEIKPTPRNKLAGLLADALQGGLEFATNNGKNKPMNLLAELLALPAIQKTADRLSYGEPLTTGKGFTTRLQPETFDAAMGVLPFAGSMGRGANYAAEGLNKGAAMIGKAAAPSTERLVNAVMAKGGLPAQLMQDMAQGTKSPAITYHASPVKLDLKDRYGKGYDELYDLVNSEASNSLSMDKYDAFRSLLKKYENGNLGNNAGKKADQLYVSNQPDAWKSVQMDELNVPYDLGGVYGLEVKKAPEYYMQKSGMGQQLPEAVIDAKDVITQYGPYATKAELDKYLASIGKLDGTPSTSKGNERLLKILERNGESVAPKTKFEYPIGDRDILAQQRAALPLPPAGVDITKLPQAEARKYGLGLRADNTALERANASKEADSIFDMNFNNDVYHGGGSDIHAPSYDFSGKGHDQYGSAALYTATNPTLASGYAEKALEGANVMPLRINTKGFVSDTNVPNLTSTQIAEMIKKSPDKDAIYNFGDVDYEGLNKVIGNAVKEYKSVSDDSLSQLNMLSNDFYPNNPAEFNKGISKLTGIRGVTADVGAGEKFHMPWHEDDIRSRFAAFDPWRRNAAIAAAMGVAAPDLLAKDNNELASILKSKK